MAEFPLSVLQIWRSQKRVTIQIQLMNIHESECKYYCLHFGPQIWRYVRLPKLAAAPDCWALGLILVSEKTSYHKISWSLGSCEIVSLYDHITLKFYRHHFEILEAPQQCCWGSCQISEWLQIQISQTYNKSSYWLFNWGPWLPTQTPTWINPDVRIVLSPAVVTITPSLACVHVVGSLVWFSHKV